MKLVALFALLALTACASEELVSTKFDPAEAEIIRRSGTGSISGQAFLKTVGGEVRYAAGNPVLLAPVTAYFREAIAKQYGTGECSSENVHFKNPELRLLQYIKVTKADGEGRFRFDRLASGDYFVGTYVNWGVPTSNGNAAQQRCQMYDQVAVSDGQESKIMLSRN